MLLGNIEFQFFHNIFGGNGMCAYILIVVQYHKMADFQRLSIQSKTNMEEDIYFFHL